MLRKINNPEICQQPQKGRDAPLDDVHVLPTAVSVDAIQVLVDSVIDYTPCREDGDFA